MSRPPLFAIADGMGGARAGEVASALAASALEESSAGRGGEAYVVELIQEANRRVHERASTDAETSGMGTTITVALIERDGTVTMGHVGDSRAYLFRDGHARQLTEDHSWIQEQVRAGLLTPGEAKESRFRNIITRSVGFEPLVTPDLQDLHPQAGDCFLLCSDGLSNYIPVEEIGQILTTDFYRDAPRALIALANDRGGDDNVTCICVHVANDAP